MWEIIYEGIHFARCSNFPAIVYMKLTCVLNKLLYLYDAFLGLDIQVSVLELDDFSEGFHALLQRPCAEQSVIRGLEMEHC
jgi:hypothetical protein